MTNNERMTNNVPDTKNVRDKKNVRDIKNEPYTNNVKTYAIQNILLINNYQKKIKCSEKFRLIVD